MSNDQHEVGAVTAAAASAAPALRRSTAAHRALWLSAVADRLEAASEELLPLAEAESHLDPARLRGELTRTTRQLRFFGDVIRDGGYLEAAIDHAVADAASPTPDLRRMLVPIGPVAVFSASNFPFAFSVAGGDTASALAAGNPVIVKGHSAHPRLSERTAELVGEALGAAGAPSGAFGHLLGRAAGTSLVTDPHIAAVGFTGSLGGGRALFDLAVGRPDPIPFYGELGSVNPVVITPAALHTRGEELAAGLAASFQLGAGQYCTKPGMVFVPRGGGFAERVAGRLEPSPVTLLSDSIADGFRHGLGELAALPGMEVHRGDHGGDGIRAVVLSTSIESVLENPSAHLVECFGPVTVIVEYSAPADVLRAIRALGGSLTATLHGAAGEDIADIADELSVIAGRVLFDGWPTGVAVGWAQQHGGPWPSSTSPHTSVGATAIRRFLRPVAWQSAPDHLLPPELREANPLGIPRRVDGALVLGGRGGAA